MADDDIYSGFTLEAAILGHAAILSTITHAKLHISPAFDGSLGASAYTTRVAATYGAADANGLFNLTAPFSFTGLTEVENTWGVTFWTASTAGKCRMVRRFQDMKYVFNGDTLTVTAAPVQAEAVGL
ncbi:MAG: hypothetical protein PGN30_10125 [Mycolicibacterium neoaurum]|uniref:hypothetical protein n=1 Tax=Mycolicibacterium neoaurum TaxID=1795 RepID=UPI002FF8DE5D